jgi:diguanylate cyclase (GGDEF)-like protein
MMGGHIVLGTIDTMSFQAHPYSFFLFASALISAAVGIVAFARRDPPVMRSLAFNVFALTVWALCYGLVWINTGLPARIYWFKSMYFGVVVVPLSFLVLVLDATQQRDWLNRERLVLLLIEPVIMLAVVWSNEFHHLFIASFENYVRADLVYLRVSRGPLYWANVAYSYGLLLASMIVLVRAFLRGAPLFRTQLFAFLVGASIPWAGNIATLLGLVPLPGLDITPVAFGISGIIFYYALFRQRRYDLLPAARSRLIQEISDGLLVLDSSFRILNINPAAERLLQVDGYAVVGWHCHTVFPEWAGLQDRLEDGSEELHAEVQAVADPSRYYDVKVTPLRNRRSISGYLILFRDISERWLAAEQLRQTNQELSARLKEIESLHRKLRAQATRDPLTNLYNRRYLEEALEKELARAERNGNAVSVIMLDADKFKRINDIYGHKAGDLALQTLAKTIQTHIRRSDIACRYGGEEFVIVMPSTETEIARGRAEEIRRDFQKAELFGPGTAGKASLSIGIASYPAAGRRGDEVLDAADQAMYAAKIAGGNRIKIQKRPVKKELAVKLPRRAKPAASTGRRPKK